MKIIGISAYYHDSAVALISDGEILYASQEERFTRFKGDASFPINALSNLFHFLRLNPGEIDAFVFYDKPLLKFERLLETYVDNAPRGYRSFRKAIPIWLKEKLFLKREILLQLRSNFGIEAEGRLFFSEHHMSHAASAFYPSPYSKAAILTLDGVGEWATTSLAIGDSNKITFLKEIHFPHSLGLLYSAFTYYTGFKVNSGESKMMGLAPYGEPKYASLIKDKLIDIKNDGSFKLNMEYFDFVTNLKMTNSKFNDLFGGGPRTPESKITKRDMDLARSIQVVTEEIIMKLGSYVSRETGEKNLTMAGGVALNCVANGKLLRSNIFESIWIQPAAGDSGGALGAALAYYYNETQHPRRVLPEDSMKGALLGPSFSQKEVKDALDSVNAHYEIILPDEELVTKVAKLLVEGKIIGWHQGRMEFGPRALGSRSILGDPRDRTIQTRMNLKIKRRESFRPFAPSILGSKVNEYFDIKTQSPYMLFTANLLEKHRYEIQEKKLLGLEQINEIRSNVPSVTHIDFSARLQTVHEESNPLYFKIISEFEKLTGVPLVVNTSFNVRGEPLVCTPLDSFNCFLNTEIDILVIDHFILRKEDQKIKFNKTTFEFD